VEGRSNMNNAIFLPFDNNFTLYARACINSIKRNFPEHPRMLVLYDGSEPAFLSFLAGMDNLDLVKTSDMNEIFARFGLQDSDVNDKRFLLYKYLAWSELFEPYDNVLYLDVDTLVLRPLDEMLSTAEFLIIPDNEIRADARVFQVAEYANSQLLELLHEDGLPLFDQREDMCNAGVFVIPKKFRTNQHLRQLLNIRQRYDRFFAHADQSVISIWCRLNAIRYTPRFDFNFQQAMLNSDIKGYDENNVYIIHFSTTFKPNTMGIVRWNRIDFSTKKRLIKLFFSYANEELSSIESPPSLSS
jgi:lipopolysaccharide biosynthesis glycosyltransferase